MRRTFISYAHIEPDRAAARRLHRDLVVADHAPWLDEEDLLPGEDWASRINQEIRECDIFVMLFFTKVGKYTEEEFETAVGQFKATNKPFIFTYFKDAAKSGDSDEDDKKSLLAFQEKLAELGHFYTRYQSTEDLSLQFGSQLDKLADKIFIEMAKPNPDRTLIQKADKIYNIDKIDKADFS